MEGPGRRWARAVDLGLRDKVVEVTDEEWQRTIEAAAGTDFAGALEVPKSACVTDGGLLKTLWDRGRWPPRRSRTRRCR